jgi:hypothetical protein
MSLYWQKLGLLYDPTQSNRHPKLLTHAANPLPVHLMGILTVFFIVAETLRIVQV